VSSRPEPPDLEGFIEDSFFLDRLPPGSRERLVRYYEPFRDRIEYAMQESFDPETMSWRDWRNSYWDYLPPAPLEELKMADDEIRALERAAATDPAALTRPSQASGSGVARVSSGSGFSSRSLGSTSTARSRDTGRRRRSSRRRADRMAPSRSRSETT
jgi:hypothetical protein